jgi:hypothetical protein
MKRVLRSVLIGLAVLAACVPIAAVITLALLPFWSWVEATLGIEAVGHSGPADWCFEAVYGVCVVSIGLWLQIRPRRRKG